jgi:hypothetical protein
MKHHFDILGLQEDASQEQIQEAYHRLSKELNPANNDNQDFFVEEYQKLQEAYKALNQSSILKNSDSSSGTVRSNRDATPAGSSSSAPSGSFTVTISPEKIEELKNKAQEVNYKPPKSYSWWKFDDEYISGSQYFGRSIIGVLLSLIVVGFYLQAVTAYKRSKSLGNSTSTNNFFGIWGGVSGIIGFTPAAPLNIIPHWYLWFSNGRNPYQRN